MPFAAGPRLHPSRPRQTTEKTQAELYTVERIRMRSSRNAGAVFSPGKHKKKRSRKPAHIVVKTAAHSLLFRCYAVRENQGSKRFRDMEIWCRSSGRLPCGVKSRFDRSFNTVKIDSPLRSRIKSLNKRLHRQRQLRNPPPAGFIQCHPPPQLAFQIVFFARCDVQINPHPIRADFEFLVASSMRSVGLKKNLGDVSIPKLIAPSVGLGIRKNCDHTVLRLESQIERLSCP